jgi:hypothetical protein
MRSLTCSGVSVPLFKRRYLILHRREGQSKIQIENDRECDRLRENEREGQRDRDYKHRFNRTEIICGARNGYPPEFQPLLQLFYSGWCDEYILRLHFILFRNRLDASGTCHIRKERVINETVEV